MAGAVWQAAEQASLERLAAGPDPSQTLRGGGLTLSFAWFSGGTSRKPRDESPPILLPLPWGTRRALASEDEAGRMTERSRPVAYSTADLRRSKCDRDSFPKRPRLPVTVVLDEVRDAYNIGAIFRLCDAIFVEFLIVAGVEVNLRKRRLARAAQGTQHWTPWAQVDAAEVAVARAKADGWRVVVVEQDSNSIRPEDFAPAFPVCVVLGGERGGVSSAVMRLADAVIEIPMRGMANSINVATAAAIVLYSISLRAMSRDRPRSTSYQPSHEVRLDALQISDTFTDSKDVSDIRAGRGRWLTTVLLARGDLATNPFGFSLPLQQTTTTLECMVDCQVVAASEVGA